MPTPHMDSPEARVEELEAQITQLDTLRLENEAGLRAQIDILRAALKPLAEIAAEYRKNALDECRPEWGDGEAHDSQRELFSGRGGKCLLKLEHALRAEAAMRL